MSKIKIENARISFPSLFKKAVFEGIEGKYEATFLINKQDDKTYKILMNAINNLIKESKLKIPQDKICLKDGDYSSYDGYENCWSLKSASLKRPLVLNRDKNVIYEEDEIIYAGCYVNAIIDFWVQNNKYGKRINSNLYGVQFVKDGEPFVKNDSDVTDEFSVIESKENSSPENSSLQYSDVSFP